MHIAYDARSLPVNDNFDGVGRYTYELAHAMARHSSHTFTWLISDERQIEKLPAGDYVMINRPDDLLREITLSSRLNQLNADVVYSTFYLMGASFGKRNYKLVLTIHDLTYFRYRTPPQWLPFYQRVTWRMFNSVKWPTRLLLRQADAVATVSETVAQELQDWRMTKRPITAIFNAPPVLKSPPTKHDHASSDTIIYMGAFTPYKNVELLIDAMAALPDCNLRLLSRIPRQRREQLEQRAREKAVQSHVIFHDGVTDSEFYQLLNSARCLVTASRAEGFGLPILEAQAHGVPVACSDTPIFHEVAGDAAVFFSPDSSSECADVIRSLTKPKASAILTERGLKNIHRYSWDLSARAAIALCVDLVKKD